jgi:predicted dehydrogenase
MTQRHRVLIVGTGSIGERHLRCFLATGRADVAFVENNPARAGTIAKRYTHARQQTDVDAAIASGVDVAVIATPAPLHVPLATRFADANVAVLIEKPLAVTLDGVERLIQIVRERGVVAGVAYVYRSHPVLSEMRAAIDAGEIGEPLEIVAIGGQHFPTYRPAYKQTYYASHASGGGAVQDALTHTINLAEWMVGPIDRVVADVACQVLETVDVEDTTHVLARHGAVMANYSLNQHQAPNEFTFSVIGRGGVARYESHLDRWRHMQRPETPWIDHPPARPIERDDWFMRQAQLFLDAVERKREPLCTIEQAGATLRVNLAILESARSHRWIDLPEVADDSCRRQERSSC